MEEELRLRDGNINVVLSSLLGGTATYMIADRD